jgi:hypothetical protein
MGVWTWALLLSRCAIFWVTSPAILTSVYFSDRVLCFFPWLASDSDLPTHSLPHSWAYSCVPPCLLYLLRWCFTKFFPDLCLPNKGDYRHVSLCLAFLSMPYINNCLIALSHFFLDSPRIIISMNLGNPPAKGKGYSW